MIEIKIPKEINRYEARFIGPFTLRQCVSLAIALPFCVIMYNLLKPYVPLDLLGVLIMIPAAVAFLFGWFKPYGMKFEKFLQNVFITAFVAPSIRKYRTENFYSDIARQIRKEELAERESQNGKIGKKKYVRSKDAIR